MDIGCQMPGLHKYHMHLPSGWSLCHSQVTRQGVAAIIVIANKVQNREKPKCC